jgi:enoyl-CoA hydratase/carnithine racemase
MMCDIIIAGENAAFGQPEIKIGTIPGCGGTQRLTRVIGKSRAMEMILTGEPIKAQEALQRGLVSRVVPADKSLDEAIELAKKIASMPRLISISCKDAVNAAYETTLKQGVSYEQRLFWATFATEDRKIGMESFANKKTPEWKNQ